MLPNIMQLSGSIIDETAVKEYLKIDGYQIFSEMSMKMMGTNMRVTTEVVEINPKKAAPASVYAVPAGYKKLDKLHMKRAF